MSNGRGAHWLAVMFVLVFGLPVYAQTPNPAPALIRVSPTSLKPGGGQFVLVIRGANFSADSVVDWNGAALATTYADAGELTAIVPAANVANAGTAEIKVVTPSPGGGDSSPIFFSVSGPTPNLTFGAPGGDAQIALASDDVPVAMVAGDFSAQGKLDLAVAAANNVGGGDLVRMQDLGQGGFTSDSCCPAPASSDVAPVALVAGDFNNDGYEDLVQGNRDGTISVFLLLPAKNEFEEAMNEPFGGATAMTALAAGDFNRDGHLDLAIDTGTEIIILLGNGTGTQFTAGQTIPLATAPDSSPALLAGDFTGSGNLDLAAAITGGGGGVEILAGHGDGTFAPPVSYAAGPSACALARGDFNGDGTLDLAVANCAQGTVSILLNSGSGVFGAPRSFPTGLSTLASIATGDLFENGHLDLVAGGGASSPGAVAVLPGNGDGTFQAAQSFPLPNAGVWVPALAVGDTDGDGRPSIAAAESGAAAVAQLLQIPVVSLQPSVLNFGDQAVNTVSAPQNVTLGNTGSAPLLVNSIGITGNVIPFQQGNDCGQIVAADGSCTIKVSFDPLANGPPADNNQLSINDNALSLNQYVTLSGNGISPFGTLSTAEINFGSGLVGALPSQSVTLTNSGVGDLTINGIVVTAGFDLTNTCGSSLAVNATCNISVRVASTAPGGISGTLSINSNTTGPPLTIPLKGVVQDFGLAAANGSGSKTISPGQAASFTLVVTPLGGLAQPVALSCGGAPSEAACSLSQATVALNGSSPTTVTLTVSTTAASATAAPPPDRPGGPPGLIWAALGLAGLLGLVWRIGRKPGARSPAPGFAIGMAILLMTAVFLVGCGGGGGAANPPPPPNPGTPAGTYTLTVTGSVSGVTHSTKVQLVVQ